ncbi:MAG TPA: glutamate--tRNA ligase [Puia sp.]|nr:glutamate--tRNA ligase [Puia sp.]
MSKKVRLRFAPSPTGGLHLGGVRTVLYNYLFARRHGGDFILRIEDTDQSRFVPGAEQYILDCLTWCGLEPDESPYRPGAYGPYRQSERKAQGLYEKYAAQLIKQGHAYYAFDTPAELEEMRAKYKTTENPSPQYNHQLRKKMKNSLTLAPEEVQQLLAAGTPHVIRIKVDAGQEVRFTDLIRGEVHFSTDGVDDKVLLKADGMPTYHLAVVVDDRLMEITHAFRGEEWLPSAPVHILLWKYLFGEEHMPQWAHLPLILKPDGNGKLSKRDGDRLGFPVFAMNWTDPNTSETTKGFREIGFLPEAFLNMLAMLGWNDGSGQELFTLDELVEKFALDRVHKGGAKFDFDKAKWFNHEWIKRLPVANYKDQVKAFFMGGVAGDGSNMAGIGSNTAGGGSNMAGIAEAISGPNEAKFEQVLTLVKERCTLLSDFVQQASFFFVAPTTIDLASVQPKWTAEKQLFFAELIRQFGFMTQWEALILEKEFKEMAAAAAIKPGDLLQPLRIMLVGGKFGPGVFDIAALLGKEETLHRIKHVLGLLKV